MPKIKEKAPAVGRPAGAKKGVRQHPDRVKPIISQAKMQEEVTEQASLTSVLENEFIPRRLLSEKLSNIYYHLGRTQLNKDELFKYAEKINGQGKEFRFNFMQHSLRCRECGTLLEFAFEDGNMNGKPKLYNANFCKDRLCPMCSRRRSLKIFGQVSRIMDVIGDDYLFLFLTLTVPNVPAEALSETLNRLNKAFSKLLQYSAVQKVVEGYFRALEVTYNTSRNDYHPHFHCILAVPKSYTKSRDYIKRDKWLELWRKAYKDESITQLDVRLCRNKHVEESEVDSAEALKSAVAEVAKYAVKLDLDSMSADVIKTLALCLADRRLAVFDREKAFGKTVQKLKLDDAESETADLVHLDEINPHVALMIVQMSWTCGAYKITRIRTKGPNEEETES